MGVDLTEKYLREYQDEEPVKSSAGKALFRIFVQSLYKETYLNATEEALTRAGRFRWQYEKFERPHPRETRKQKRSNRLLLSSGLDSSDLNFITCYVFIR